MGSSSKPARLGRAAAGLVARGLATWLRRQRDRYRDERRAVILDAAMRLELAPFFDDELLRSVRFVTLETGLPERPPLFRRLRMAGISESVLTSFTDVAAITYQDVVVMPRGTPDLAHLPLVFHELVHVVQFEELGTRGFLERYVEGWFAAGCRYEGIPLEIDAYALQRRFQEEPGVPFDVRREVARQLARP